RVTQKGRDFLANPVKFEVVEDTEFTDTDNEPTVRAAGAGAADPVLFSILKDLRKKVARKHGLPPYIIFQDPSLEAMATTYP
ncbi:ATP-dependent DNA helicase RecQ, partial [Xanthomonas citri pv. citri]|nr:ATP-dependent DNA helicase RecQ [Xanthomonas citri pv. citri]